MSQVPDMVERVAAILMARVNAPEQEIYRTARAVIEAMREPTPEMFAAAGAPVDGDTQFISAVYETWQDMIDAALSDSREDQT